MTMDEKQVLELFKTLGRIEAKQSAQCKDIDEIKEQLKQLPCDSCNEKIAKKPGWNLLLPIIAAAFIFTSGSFMYTYDIEKEVKSPHFVKEVIEEADEELNDAVEENKEHEEREEVHK